MQVLENESKKRYSIFKNQLFTDPVSFQTVPYPFDFKNTITYVLDHTSQTISAYHTKLKKPQSISNKNRIFDKKRSHSQKKKESVSSFQQTGRCASFFGDKTRNHVIFGIKKGIFSSDQQLVKQHEQQSGNSKILEYQSQPQKEQAILNIINKNEQQTERVETSYRQQLLTKINQRQKQKISVALQKSQIDLSGCQRQLDLSIMKPQQYAKMIKQVRMASKCKRTNIAYPIPKVLSEVPCNEDFNLAIKARQRQGFRQRQGLVYRI